jgi:hypothetical protein
MLFVSVEKKKKRLEVEMEYDYRYDLISYLSCMTRAIRVMGQKNSTTTVLVVPYCSTVSTVLYVIDVPGITFNHGSSTEAEHKQKVVRLMR